MQAEFRRFRLAAAVTSVGVHTAGDPAGPVNTPTLTVVPQRGATGLNSDDTGGDVINNGVTAGGDTAANAGVTPSDGPTRAGSGEAAEAYVPGLLPGPGTVMVLSTQTGDGGSTVALAVADAAAAGRWVTHQVGVGPALHSGLAGVSTRELGVDPTGEWRRGTRGLVTLDRQAGADARRGLAGPGGHRRSGGDRLRSRRRIS